MSQWSALDGWQYLIHTGLQSQHLLACVHIHPECIKCSVLQYVALISLAFFHWHQSTVTTVNKIRSACQVEKRRKRSLNQLYNLHVVGICGVEFMC